MNGRLKQVVHHPEEFEPDIRQYNVRHLPQNEQLKLHDYTVAAAMGESFDFENGPLFRVLAFEASASYYVIYFIFHHVISDQRSTEIFNKELVETYKMLLWDPAHKLSENYVQYREYAQFENELLNSSKGDKCRKYWLRSLANGIPGLSCVEESRRNAYAEFYSKKLAVVKEKFYQLPFYDERLLASVVRRYQVEDAGEVIYVYDRQLFEKLAAFESGSKNGFLALLTASVLLAFNKIDGQKEFAFEIPASRRVYAKYSQTIGWLTGSGPCYFNIAGHNDANSLLDYVDEQLYDLSSCCAYQYETLFHNDAALPGSHMPVFLSVSYLGKNNPSKETGIIFTRSNGSGTYQDLGISFTRYNDSLALKMTFNNILFTTELVERVILEQVISLRQLLSGSSNIF
jgi:hypothetical protein